MSRYDLCTGRNYQDRDGNEKTMWTRIGSMFPAKTGEGYAIKLDALPLPNEKGEVWVKAFPFVPKEERQEPAPAPRAAPQERQRPSGFPERPSASTARLDDEIPFAAEFR